MGWPWCSLPTSYVDCDHRRNLAGVADHVIVADYAISGANMAELVERLKRDRPEALTAMNEQPSAYMAAPPEAMKRLLAHVNAEYGSMTGYVNSIGISTDVIDSLAASLLDSEEN